MEIIKQLVLNLAVLLIFIFFLQFRINKAGDLKTKRRAIFLYFVIAVFLCMLLSIKSGDNIRFDLRQVPIIVGTLYLGSWAGVPFFLITIIARAIMGVDTGLWVCTFVYGIQTIALNYLHSPFLHFKTFGRVAVAVLVSFFSSLILLIFLIILGKPVSSFELFTGFLIIPSLGAGMMSYTIEKWLEIRESQERLINSEKLESVSHLSSALAHEIRNPMTVAKGFMQLIFSDDLNKEKKKEYALIAVNELNRAETIIKEFLNYAKPSVNQFEYIYLAEGIKKVISLVEPLANKHTVQIMADCNSNQSIRGDKVLIEQCLLNLFKNAIESMEDGGTLTICLNNQMDKLIIDIIDTGIGMSEEQLRKIGKPFYSTKGDKGTGLGLMTTFNIIKRMNGDIHLASKLGVGTTFTLSFPVIDDKKPINTKLNESNENGILLKI